MNQNYGYDTGRARSESLGWGFLKALHPEDRDRYPAQQQQAVSKGQPYEIKYRLLGADGSYHWLIEQAIPVLEEDGLVQDWMVTCTPVKEAGGAGEMGSWGDGELLSWGALELGSKQIIPPLCPRQSAQRGGHGVPSGDGGRPPHAAGYSASVKALWESEERYRSLVVATSQIVWITDAQGQVVDMPAWRAYTGQSESEVKGRGWLEALHPEDRDRTAQVWSVAVRTKSIYDTEYRIRAADGSYRYFCARGVPVLAEDGSIREWVGTCTDITEYKASEEALKAHAEELNNLLTVLAQTNAALEKRNQELDQFAYVASHDLKAPLRAIANLSEWIEEDISDLLNDENRHQMNLLRGRVHRLEALIDGLLQYSRVGRIKTKAEPVDVTALLVEVLNSLAPPPEFTVTVEPGMPTLVTQRLPLFQVFSNLISNSIKHHHRPNGNLRISVEDQGQFYEFAVADDGPGIAPQYHEKVFGIFQTLEARDKVENTGVGLAIVKKIVEVEGGRICLESQEGQGATFRFTWPK